MLVSLTLTQSMILNKTLCARVDTEVTVEADVSTEMGSFPTVLGTTGASSQIFRVCLPSPPSQVTHLHCSLPWRAQAEASGNGLRRGRENHFPQTLLSYLPVNHRHQPLSVYTSSPFYQWMPWEVHVYASERFSASSCSW